MRVNGCFCSDPSVHQLDGLALSSFTDAKTAEAVMTAYLKTLLTHDAFDPDICNDFYCVMLNEHDKVNTMQIQLRQIPQENEEMRKLIRWDHPHAKDGQHVIVLILMAYGPEGCKFSRASGFIKKKAA